MIYSIFKSNGQILRIVQTTEIDKQLQNGEMYIEGFANDANQYISNGIIVNIPTKPNGAAYFDYDTKQWVLNYPAQELIVKDQRDTLLYKSDWTQIPNNPLTPEVQQQWADYRQQLRDITAQPGYPYNVIWPTQPE